MDDKSIQWHTEAKCSILNNDDGSNANLKALFTVTLDYLDNWNSKFNFGKAVQNTTNTIINPTVNISIHSTSAEHIIWMPHMEKVVSRFFIQTSVQCNTFQSIITSQTV